jgi:hypothetical protein
MGGMRPQTVPLVNYYNKILKRTITTKIIEDCGEWIEWVTTSYLEERTVQYRLSLNGAQAGEVIQSSVSAFSPMRLAIKPGARGGNTAEIPATPWIGLEL